MGTKILVAYATKSGSTAEVAQAIGTELVGCGAQVDVLPVRRVLGLSEYDAVVVGGPMIMGWHDDAARFVAKRQEALSQKPVAYFVTSLSLTRTDDDRVDGIPVFLDPSLARPPRHAGRLSFKEEYALVSNYLNPILRNAPMVRPVSAGFFNGKLDTARLDLVSRGFVSLVIGARSGDFRNWEAVRAWAAEAGSLLMSGKDNRP